ncbi:MAG: HAMP domain-containing histidine kinase, partial [Krumholzibacteria bacterium]|nr:HAMP domain-containing histidine kinase [Candidatus Krumholzibacteria bacterium]
MDRVHAPESPRTGSAAATPEAATAADLQAEVRRLRAENRTLVRLNRLQGRFVAMASHEFKTPLTSITAYTDALVAHVGQPGFDRAPQFLAVIREESARLLRMVNRILDFSRLEYGSRLLDRQPTDLVRLVAECLRTLEASAGAKRQQLSLSAAPDLPWAEIDADLVRQVVVNLAGNAVKFAPRGGRIEVSVAEDAAFVTVEVADDGPGVPPEELRRIFREFYRAEGTAAGEGGTGLGLSIVRHIVSLHGGHVTVRGRPGGGSVFSFGVPKEVHCPADGAAQPAAHPEVLRALA